MKRFKVTIRETLEKCIFDVAAESEEEACEIVENEWYKGNYILNAENFTGVAYEAEEYKESE